MNDKVEKDKEISEAKSKANTAEKINKRKVINMMKTLKIKSFLMLMWTNGMRNSSCLRVRILTHSWGWWHLQECYYLWQDQPWVKQGSLQRSVQWEC